MDANIKYEPVVCVRNTNIVDGINCTITQLIIGKIYYIINKRIFYDEELYQIQEIKVGKFWYSSQLFEKLSDIREEKLDKILNTL